MSDPSEIRRKIDTEADFINLKRFDFSLEKMMDRYPDGVPDDERGLKMMAAALNLTEAEVETEVEVVVQKLRKALTRGHQ
jgi:hypothetical protein